MPGAGSSSCQEVQIGDRWWISSEIQRTGVHGKKLPPDTQNISESTQRILMTHDVLMMSSHQQKNTGLWRHSQMLASA